MAHVPKGYSPSSPIRSWDGGYERTQVLLWEPWPQTHKRFCWMQQQDQSHRQNCRGRTHKKTRAITATVAARGCCDRCPGRWGLLLSAQRHGCVILASADSCADHHSRVPSVLSACGHSWRIPMHYVRNVDALACHSRSMGRREVRRSPSRSATWRQPIRCSWLDR